MRKGESLTVVIHSLNRSLLWRDYRRGRKLFGLYSTCLNPLTHTLSLEKDALWNSSREKWTGTYDPLYIKKFLLLLLELGEKYGTADLNCRKSFSNTLSHDQAVIIEVHWYLQRIPVILTAYENDVCAVCEPSTYSFEDPYEEKLREFKQKIKIGTLNDSCLCLSY